MHDTCDASDGTLCNYIGNVVTHLRYAVGERGYAAARLSARLAAPIIGDTLSLSRIGRWRASSMRKCLPT